MAYGDAGQSGGQSGQGGYCAIHVESESAFPDYDYKIEGGKTYIIKEENVRKYYKYITIYEDWTQPILNSNGTMGGSSFAVSGTVTNGSYQPYMVFNTNTAYNDAWIAQTGQPVFTFYNPDSLKVTNIQVTNPRFANSYAVTGGTVLGSNDNSNWTTIKSFSNSNTANGGVWNINLSDNTSLYNYYKIAITSHANDWGGFDRLDITAKQQGIGIKESDSTDYDFYKDVDVYKAIKSYTKGQYYGN